MFIHYHIYIDSIPTVNPGHIFGGRLIFRRIFGLVYRGLYSGGLYSKSYGTVYHPQKRALKLVKS